MNIVESLILGLIQGLTEFLPVSSSGHLEIGKYIFGVDTEGSFAFSVAVHGATVLSTIVVFRSELLKLIRGALKLRYNDETEYLMKIGLSMVPVFVVGIFFKDKIEKLFTGDVRFVGSMLIVTSVMLISTGFFRKRSGSIGWVDAIVIGIAQAVAVIPGISRSGATISTGIVLGKDRAAIARFSFLMVLLPVIGANLLELFSGEMNSGETVSLLPLVSGFLAAFVSGYLACRWMISIVRRGKLYWFGIYCLLAGIVSLVLL